MGRRRIFTIKLGHLRYARPEQRNRGTSPLLYFTLYLFDTAIVCALCVLDAVRCDGFVSEPHASYELRMGGKWVVGCIVRLNVD